MATLQAVYYQVNIPTSQVAQSVLLKIVDEIAMDIQRHKVEKEGGLSKGSARLAKGNLRSKPSDRVASRSGSAIAINAAAAAAAAAVRGPMVPIMERASLEGLDPAPHQPRGGDLDLDPIPEQCHAAAGQATASTTTASQSQAAVTALRVKTAGSSLERRSLRSVASWKGSVNVMKGPSKRWEDPPLPSDSTAVAPEAPELSRHTSFANNVPSAATPRGSMGRAFSRQRSVRSEQRAVKALGRLEEDLVQQERQLEQLTEGILSHRATENFTGTQAPADGAAANEGSHAVLDMDHVTGAIDAMLSGGLADELRTMSNLDQVLTAARYHRQGRDPLPYIISITVVTHT